MPRMAVGLANTPATNTNADEADVNIEGLLAQAEAIKDNPDEFLPVEVADEALV